ncbi:MAG TPA: GatB/YqeY domain-containing protein [Gemmatimonadales bacterium]|nr:GatB/YqeY domain-containing protein [Gemmatimonadales bacterium]
MADLATSLRTALVAARKAQDKERTLVLGTIIANLKNRELELGRNATDDEVVDVLRKGIKLRREALEQFGKAGRRDLAEVETGQIRVLEEFLPAQADAEEIRAAVRAAIAAGARDIGKVMGAVLPKLKGRADGKIVNQIAREELAAG